MWLQEKYNEAMKFAGLAHKGQKHCQTEASYLVHVSEVAAEAMAVIALNKHENCDANFLVQAAILHDCIEDTEATYEIIENQFGKKMADGISALSKQKNLDKDKTDKSKSLIDSINRIKKEPKEIAMVKLCDRITNMQPAPIYWTKEKKENYKNEAQIILNELGCANAYLKERLKTKIKNYIMH